jgi:thiol-disulfide isomerase/thioredoxin
VSRIAVIAAAFVGVALAAAAAGIYVWHLQTSSVPFARASKPKEVPALRFVDASEKERSLADFRGKVVLLNIWATWCAPCREEMPALDRLQGELGGPGFQVVALSVDQEGSAIARRFFAEVGIKSLDFYIDRSARAAFTLDAAGLPATLLIDREGREIGRHLGAAKWDSPEIVEALRRRITRRE